ncbi:MAG TPA: diaminopimelate epimerase [Labilithrix sp.]|jgi:diaminopimelate epimerase
MKPVRFEKYEGLGNDFVLLEHDRDDAVTPSLVRAICDRRFGVGGDGVLVLLPPSTPGAAARMRVVNADGSVPEMCGNGLRCAVLHVARKRTMRAGELVFDTDAGTRSCVVRDDDQITIDMGEVRVTGEMRIDLDGDAWDLVTADAGNPHAVAIRDVPHARFAEVGPRLATHPTFSAGTNVELARFRAGGIDLDVWERGVGLTLACGTGACATAAVAVAKGAFAAGAEIPVRLPGGTLHVTMTPSGHAIMRGPARHAFGGELDLDDYAKRAR